jgi:hypothetical protein
MYKGLNVALRVLKYLKGSPGRGIFFPRASGLHIQGYTDADWARCKYTRRSISGYCFFLGQSLFFGEQRSNLLYPDLLLNLSIEPWHLLHVSFNGCSIYSGIFMFNRSNFLSCIVINQSAMHIAGNLVFHERTKHLEIDCHIMMENLQVSLFMLLLVTGHDQLTDFFTKSLFPQLFNLLLSKLGLLDIYQPPTCGGMLHNDNQSKVKHEDKEPCSTSY